MSELFITDVSFTAGFYMMTISAKVFLFDRFHFRLADFAEEGHVMRKVSILFNYFYEPFFGGATDTPHSVRRVLLDTPQGATPVSSHATTALA